VKGLFGFDYIWEVYVPAAKRRYGYYVLPLLFGDRLVGRIEPRYERASRTLRILGIWFEDGFGPMEEPPFVPALADALEAYASFVGARSISWPRTRPGRDLALALSRLRPAASGGGPPSRRRRRPCPAPPAGSPCTRDCA
jgi:uncharacterized protein YcaQ